MKLFLRPNVVLAEPEMLLSSIVLPEGTEQFVYIVRQSAHPDISVGDKVLCTPKAGLKVRSNGSRFVLLDAGDILARLE